MQLWFYRDLLFQLVRREVVVRYRHSIMGVAWALLQPLGLMLLFTFVFTRAVSLGAIDQIKVPYPLFVYVGVLPWTLFASGLTGATSSLVSHRNLVTKVYFPQQILPLTSITVVKTWTCSGYSQHLSPCRLRSAREKGPSY